MEDFAEYEMNDYKKLGLKVGIEIHRQIESHKLFCHCPSELREDAPEFHVMRRLRSVASETGEQDVVADFEMKKGNHAVYEGHQGNACAIELDEEPIMEINKAAINVVLQVCKMMNMHVVDEIQIMRKQVLDYSNTSGFQRTALAARNGYIGTRTGRVGIESACVEEDAARKIGVKGDHVIYRLDRLGIPLIEITTAPDMNDPEQVKEVASYLGMILKSTGRFKSGIGTIRQDLNVSISGHPRVEIKGVQDLRLIPKVIELEVARQLENIKKREQASEVRKMNLDGTTSFLRPMPGASRMYVETDHPPISITKEVLDSITVPELITEKTIKIEHQYGLSAEHAREIVDNELFFDFVNQFKNIEPAFIAKTLIETPKEIKSRFNLDIEKLKDKDFAFVFDHVDRNEVPRSAALEILAELCKGNIVNIENYKTASDDALEKDIIAIIDKNKGASFNALMGEVMKKYRGKVDGKKAAELIKRNM